MPDALGFAYLDAIPRIKPATAAGRNGARIASWRRFYADLLKTSETAASWI